MQDLLKNQGFKFKKNFGQNFIVDENLINKIIDLSEIDKDTLVIEIGPGAGSLTNALCKKAAYVLAYEIDSSLEAVLKDNLQEYQNYEIVFDDFLKHDVLADLKKYNYHKIYVVANLPYYITTPILMKIINDKLPVQKIVVMVQKEVGNRFKASVGTKDYSSLSVYLNYYYEVKKIIDVSRNVFIPKPNVDSIVVSFTKKENKLPVLDEEIFFKLVKDSFKQKRKTLKNNLQAYPLDKVLEILTQYNFDLNVRAEQIPLEVFVAIANNLKNV